MHLVVLLLWFGHQLLRNLLCVCDGSASANTLIADLRVHGVWQPQTEALFDIRVVDTDARSYCGRTPVMF